MKKFIFFYFLISVSLTENIMEEKSIILGGGCFWCLEALFNRLDGVTSVQSGYSGGTEKNPSYKTVCSGTTGHAEVVKISYDSSKIKLEQILDFFWTIHDPTTLNRQGADIGTQYRSIALYSNDAEMKIILDSKDAAESSKMYPNPIVTEIKLLENFYLAEDYHQDYYELNSEAPYCRFVIKPKIEKILKK